jgi:hypothetical protein
MPNPTINTALANAVLDGMDSLLNSGTIELRAGIPAGTANAAGGTLLGSAALAADLFAPANARVKGLNTSFNIPITANGTVGHFRITAGTFVMEGGVTVTGGGGVMELSALLVSSGGVVSVTAFNLSLNNAAV